MTTSTRGAGRTLPSGGDTNQVPATDTTTATDLAWRDNGARPVETPVTVSKTAEFGKVYLVDSTAGAVDITLPTPSTETPDRAPITLKRQTGSNTVRFLGTVDGATNLTVTTAKTVVTDGVAYFTI